MVPTANADAPTSLFNLLLLGLHGIGESTEEVDPHGSKSLVIRSDRLASWKLKRASCSRTEEIGTELAATSGEVGGRLDATLGQFDTPELGQAMHDDPACQALHLTD